MRKFQAQGKECDAYLERVDDECGFVTVVRVPAGDGTFYVHRSFVGRGIVQRRDKATGEMVLVPPSAEEREQHMLAAKARFENASDDNFAMAAQAALLPGVSGRRQPG